MSFRVSASIFLLIVLGALGFGYVYKTKGANADLKPANVQQTDQQAAPPAPSDREDYKNFDLPGEKKAGSSNEGSRNEQQDRGSEPPSDSKQ